MQAKYSSDSRNLGLVDAEIDGKCDCDDLSRFETRKLEQTMYNEGIRLGGLERDNAALQECFDNGFQASYAVNVDVGRIFGQSNGVLIILEQRLSIATSIDERNELAAAIHDVHSWISSTHAQFKRQMQTIETLEQLNSFSSSEITKSWGKVKSDHPIISIRVIL